VSDNPALLPREPTPEMIAAGSASLACDLDPMRKPQRVTRERAARNAYVTMLAAAPTPPAAKAGKTAVTDEMVETALAVFWDRPGRCAALEAAGLAGGQQEHTRCEDCHEPTGSIAVCCVCAAHRCESVASSARPESAARQEAVASHDEQVASTIWKSRYFERRSVIHGWHARAVALGYDGVEELLAMALPCSVNSGGDEHPVPAAAPQPSASFAPEAGPSALLNLADGWAADAAKHRSTDAGWAYQRCAQQLREAAVTVKPEAGKIDEAMVERVAEAIARAVESHPDNDNETALTAKWPEQFFKTTVTMYRYAARAALEVSGAADGRNEWRDAVLDALAIYGVDRPMTDTPAQVMQHVLACYAQQMNDPTIGAESAARQESGWLNELDRVIASNVRWAVNDKESRAVVGVRELRTFMRAHGWDSDAASESTGRTAPQPAPAMQSIGEAGERFDLHRDGMERVAKAIFDHLSQDDWGNEPADDKEVWLRIARAALEAAISKGD
jgi:hypothetical protein